MRVRRREFDEGLVAVLVLQRGGLAQHAVGHLLQVALTRQHDGDGIFLHLGLQVHLHHVGGRHQAGLARHRMLLVHLRKLVADDLLDLLLAGKRGGKLGDVVGELGDVAGAVEDVLLVDVAQLDLRHELGLHLVDAEALHEVGHHVHLELGAADDGDGLVDVEQDGLKAVQQMQAVALFLQVEGDATARRLHAPGNPFRQDLPHAHDARVAVDQHVEVARERVLQRGGAEQLRHQLLRVDAALDVDGDAQTGKVRLVADVGDLAHLAFLGELDDALDDDVRLGGVGNLVHLDDALVGQIAPTRANLEAAGARVVDALHFLAAVDDLAAGGEIGRGHVLEQVAIWIIEEMHGGRAHLVQVETANIRRHGHADALVRRHQNVGERRGKQARLLHGAVVAVHEIDRVLVDILEDFGADGRKLGLGVTAGRVAQVAGIILAEVALRFDERREQRFVARGQAHHGLVDGRVAVRVELHGLPDDVRALLARAV